ncbi:MAG: hypothetical protein M3Y69_00060 [Verrucomicrobiota bacterium]|nr:hypothetical protein [Verrucomicrobiota bacterium]
MKMPPPLRSQIVVFFSFCALTLLLSSSQAASPTGGTISPSTTAPVKWAGDATGVPAGGVAGEAACIDGQNCDVFTITVSGTQAEYAGKQILVNIAWSVAASDYDLYIHKDTLSGTLIASGANGGPPGTSESAVINPATSGLGKYVVHVLYSTTIPTDQYQGTATLVAAGATPGATPPPMRTATYITTNTGIAFSNNYPLKAPLTTRDGEPSNRTDFAGNAYVGAIRGVPAGVDLWYFDLKPGSATFDPNMRIPIYRGQPDGFTPAPGTVDLGGDGGGDIDLAVSFGMPTGQTNPTLALSSLAAANISTGTSVDLGKTFAKNPLGNSTGGVSADDREWEEFLGANTVYMLYRTLEPAVTQFQRSDDGGKTFLAAKTAGQIGQVGQIDVHQKTGVVYGSGSNGIVAVGIPASPTAEPLTYTTYQAASDPNGVAHLFFINKVADDETPNGTVYVCYSNDKDVLLKHSNDQGKTWSPAVKVNGGISAQTNIFPWMETGPKTGSVGVVWYGTDSPTNDDKAEWKVYFAQSFDANSATPTFRIAEVTEPDHVIHASNISEGGLTGAANRNLIDYFQISFDPRGAAVIAYTDDHNDYDGHTYVAHQISGLSIKDGNPLPAATEGAGLVLPPGDLFPPRVPGLNGEQVTDYPLDLQESSLARVSTTDPSDLVSVRYDTSGTGPSLAIAATMKVSDLSVIPGQTTWQMSFAVNAPHSTLSPTGLYSFGASDHADQFYLQADTDVNGAMTYSYGTVARASDGKLTYTKVGAADAGEFNQRDNTISVQVSVAKLNAVLTTAKHSLIGNGTVVAGLRGRSYTVEVVPPVSGQASRQGRRDIARGGTQFVVHDSAQPYPAATPSPTPMPAVSVAPGATPVPTPPARILANLATRAAVKVSDGAEIAGFIKRTTNTKRVMVRGVGPSLNVNGTPGAGTLPDPVIEIYDSTGAIIGTNDNWRSNQQAEISATGLAPSNDKEAALILTLTGGAGSTYTAILSDKNKAEGVGLIEVYDLDQDSFADLGNLSTRGKVGTGDEVLIGGLIIRDNSFTSQSQTVVLRGIGPSLAGAGVSGPLANPLLQLYDAQGVLITSNDDWSTSPDAAALTATGLAPSSPLESAILRTLAPGAYTTILRGADNGSGIGVVEVYNYGNGTPR